MVATPIKPKTQYTAAEYLALEEQAEFKSEFFDGEIIPMAGASANHNKIVFNFCRAFPLEIGETSYEIFMSDMRLWVPSKNQYTYPDIMIIAGEPIYSDAKQMMVTNPCVIIEVRSPSTQGYDQQDKFKAYRSIPEFKEYILIDQRSYNIEQYTKLEDGRWLLTEYNNEDQRLKLETMDFTISLKDLYKRVEFPETETTVAE